MIRRIKKILKILSAVIAFIVWVCATEVMNIPLLIISVGYLILFTYAQSDMKIRPCGDKPTRANQK